MSLRDVFIARLMGCCVALTVACGAPATSALAWESAHGDRDNNGFVDVVTLPASKAPITVPGLGTFAPGAGPVVAPDGTVYLGNTDGEVIALHADGKPYWRRSINGHQSISSSPVISSDGTVFVIGIRRVRDNRVNPPTDVMESTLHWFTASGGYVGQAPIPADRGSKGITAFQPNIWRSGNAEVLMVPAISEFTYGSGHAVRLLAYSTSGGLLANQAVTTFNPPVYGGSGAEDWQVYACIMPPFLACGAAITGGYTPPPGKSFTPPPPGPALFKSAGGAAPLVLVSDHIQDLVGYTFSGNSFTETFRVHEDGFYMRSPPVALPDGHTLVGMEDITHDNTGAPRPNGNGGVVFGPPNSLKLKVTKLDDPIYAAPTRMADGRIALVGAFGGLIVLQGAQVVTKVPTAGGSIASAAASRTHLFVSAQDAFLTFDTNSLQQVAKIDWVGGGASPPAIGPKGHVYALASNILFVFPPPKQVAGGAIVGQPLPQAQPVATNPGTPASQSYKPPLTPDGYRLFACKKLDGDDCGKDDTKDIALAFCQKQGFTQVGDTDTDKKKVKAETLDGQFCSKSKCKVFDEIVCQN
jgi:hypothetical protein